MACDRFINFGKGKVPSKVPSKKDVGKALEDYLGALMVENKWGGSRWTAQLIGTKSWPFRRLEHEDSIIARAQAVEASEERWIEVYIDKDNIDVITRRQDEVTMRIADGFAKLVARYWQGQLEMDEG